MSSNVSDPDIAERVRQLTSVGRSAADIAAALRISERTVVRYRRRVGIAKPVVEHMTVEQLARAEQLLDDGCSAAETARSVGVAPSTIRRRFPGRAWPLDVNIAHAASCSRIARAEW